MCQLLTNQELLCFYQDVEAFFLVILTSTFAVSVLCSTDRYSRKDFPPRPSFVFGAGTSAYQVEGAANEDGRTPSIWDTFAHEDIRGATGDVAADGYHKYKEDVLLMAQTGLEAYRFSISWSRLIPNGRGPVNPKGLEYYNNLINELIRHGIQPHVTLFHYDLPQTLEDEYAGWVSRKIVRDFTAYADVCFREFGDRVLHWSTINEANIFALCGYDLGFVPPKRCSAPFGSGFCCKGNSSTEPYLAAHHMLLAHARTVRLYQKNYQRKQHGFIGITLFVYWFIPLTNSTEDVVAAQRGRDFYLGWFADPLVFGDYPSIMKKNAGSRLPAFTNQELKMVRGSFDFIGVIHYQTLYVKDNSMSLKMENRDVKADMGITLLFQQDISSAYEFPIRPQGLQATLEYFKQAYGNPAIYIHENGQSTPRNSSLEDMSRVKYLQAYIGSVLDAIRNGSNARGYFVWSFLDVLELLGGYDVGYGLYYVDLDNRDLERYPKLSAHWYSNFLKGRSVSTTDGTIGFLEKNLSDNFVPVKPLHVAKQKLSINC